MTCGARGELFCMLCGDYVYSRLIDREVTRIEIAERFSWLQTPDKMLCRSISVTESVTFDSGKSFWPGLLAVYPNPTCPTLLAAGLRSLTRSSLFSGNTKFISTVPELMNFAGIQCSKGIIVVAFYSLRHCFSFSFYGYHFKVHNTMSYLCLWGCIIAEIHVT